jgi:DNA polymerase delta subunit 2
VAIISGLDVGSPSSPDAQIQLLVEYLIGEGSGSEVQVLPRLISRLIIAGNSLPPISTNDVEIEKKPVCLRWRSLNR